MYEICEIFLKIFFKIIQIFSRGYFFSLCSKLIFLSHENNVVYEIFFQKFLQRGLIERSKIM